MSSALGGSSTRRLGKSSCNGATFRTISFSVGASLMNIAPSCSGSSTESSRSSLAALRAFHRSANSASEVSQRAPREPINIQLIPIPFHRVQSLKTSQ